CTLLETAPNYPAKAFYTLIEVALERETSKQGFIDTCLHIWECFKNIANDKQKHVFLNKIDLFQKNKCSSLAIKNYLFRMAVMLEETDLLCSYFLYI
ncbi:MAG: DUF1722 domain-containing protein, partial [Clostridia bacterium]|nr:DUF1722 domain-containing protein [Clostridia bacterium]